MIFNFYWSISWCHYLWLSVEAITVEQLLQFLNDINWNLLCLDIFGYPWTDFLIRLIIFCESLYLFANLLHFFIVSGTLSVVINFMSFFESKFSSLVSFRHLHVGFTKLHFVWIFRWNPLHSIPAVIENFEYLCWIFEEIKDHDRQILITLKLQNNLSNQTQHFYPWHINVGIVNTIQSQIIENLLDFLKKNIEISQNRSNLFWFNIDQLHWVISQLDLYFFLIDDFQISFYFLLIFRPKLFLEIAIL